jgi:hypothetical protein
VLIWATTPPSSCFDILDDRSAMDIFDSLHQRNWFAFVGWNRWDDYFILTPRWPCVNPMVVFIRVPEAMESVPERRPECQRPRIEKIEAPIPLLQMP